MGMSEDILQTKLYIPPLRPNFVARPRLIQKLKQGLGGKLTLVSAPAGYGKTTLVAEGLLNPAWLSLDENDNDPTRFWVYVFAALKKVWVDLDYGGIATLKSPQPPAIETILTNLINQATVLSDKITLVLDDYHIIEKQAVHQAMAFLLDHLPPQMHLVIISRSDPPLNLARMRGLGQLTELREAELRFTAAETKRFFQQVAELRLTTDSIEALHRRTEGWVVGLQLAGLAMQGRKDTAEFVQAFTGDHSYILDYLTEEVYQRQSSTVKAFLLKSSILNRLSGPLCDAILRDDSDIPQNSQDLLEYLNQQNLFLIPLDDRRQWYRYHHFFADILRYRLRHTYSALLPDLHRRASAWFAENGFVADALHHTMAIDDFNQAADLIQTVTRPMIGGGEATTVQKWIEGLPKSILQQRPLLCVSLAWVYNLNQAGQEIEPLLQQAENALDAGTFDQEIVADVRGNVAILRGYTALQQNNPLLALQQMEKALTILSDDDIYLRSLISFTQGVIYKRGGIWQPAAEKLKAATAYGRASGNLTVAIGTRTHLIEMLITQGQLKEAASFCEEAIAHHMVDQSQNPVPYLGFVYCKLGEILFEWNELDEANQNLEHGLSLADKLMVAWSWTRDGLVYLARIQQLQGNIKATQTLIERAISMSNQMQDLFDRIDISFWQARLWLAQNNLTAAARWAHEYQINTESHTEAGDLVLARVYLAQGQTDKALEILKRIGETASADGRVYAQVETLALQALARQSQADLQQAHRTLAHALSMAEPEDFIRLFVDEGSSMAILLNQMASLSEGNSGGDFFFSRKYVVRLLSAFPQTEPTITPSMAESDALNERELQVLRLLAAGLKSPEIGFELHLAKSTIKWYLRNIYDKLGVHRRADAIARANDLKLL